MATRGIIKEKKRVSHFEKNKSLSGKILEQEGLTYMAM